MKDKNQITKLKLFFDLDKELAYIKHMNKLGWKLVYIKGGALFTFVKTEPDEYTTVFYADNKENVAETAAFAAQFGYENIPHTMDGMGDFMYLTGRKSSVSEEFINENETKARISQILFKRFRLFAVMFAVLFFIAATESVLFSYNDITWYMETGELIPFMLILDVVVILTSIFCAVCLWTLFRMIIRYKRQIKHYQSEGAVYE